MVKLLGQFQAREHMTARHDVQLTPRRQLLARVLSERLQKQIARLGAIDIGQQERLVYQRRQKVDHVGLRDVVARADGVRGGQRTSAGKYRELLEHTLFARGEQIVTPIDRRSHRLLSRQRRALPSGQNDKAMVEPVRNHLNRKYVNSRGGKFNRERDAI